MSSANTRRRIRRTRTGRRARRAAATVDPSDHVATNRRLWERTSDAYERRHAAALRQEGGRVWGLWHQSERELGLLAGAPGPRVLELGCGAARWSIGLVREGRSVVGIDLSRAHLRHAVRARRRARVRLPLVEGSAEQLPFRAAAFDVVFCDWGAMTFADPYRTVPEAARVLAPGGLFVFSTASPLRMICHDLARDRITRTLQSDYFGMHRFNFPGEVDFQLSYGAWISLFAAEGLSVERLLEGPAVPPSTYLTPRERAWGRHWPLESIWRLRKAPRGPPPHR